MGAGEDAGKAAATTRHSRDELVTLHLQQLPAAGRLAAIAVAQLIAKVLYVEPGGNSLSLAEMKKGLGLMGVPRMPDELMREGLVLLKDQRQAEERPAGWVLSEDGRRKLETSTHEHARRLHDALRRHFPERIARGRLLRWFNVICARFFERYGTQAVATLLRTNVPYQLPILLQDMVERAAKEHGLQEDAGALYDGFRDLLEHPSTEDGVLVWSAWQTLLSARLVTASSGADPIALGELRDSTAYLDTNVLLTATLELREGNASVSALIDAVKSLRISFAVLAVTLDEYLRLTKAKRSQILTLLSKFELEVLRRSGDVFVRTAVSRGCKTRADFNRFMDEVDHLPAQLRSVDVAYIDRAETRDEVRAGFEDRELQERIIKASVKTRGKMSKSDAAAAHDAALTHVIEARRREGKRSWVLTEDYSMATVALNRTSAKELPTWISPYALIPLLALDAGGPEISAADCGLLLTAMFEGDLHPPVDTYELEDLELVVEIEAAVTELKPDQVERIAITAARARLSGRPGNKGALSLELSRAVQRERRALVKAHDATALKAGTLEMDLERVSGADLVTRRALMQRIASGYRFAAWRSFLLMATAQLLLALICVVIGAKVLVESPGDHLREAIGAILMALPAPVPFEIAKHIARLRQRLEGSVAAAEREVERLRLGTQQSE